jgi:uncharacterized DUF497 family protein
MRDVLRWTLVFTDSNLEHLAERGIDAEDVAQVVFGHYGPARVRRGGRAERERWFVIGPLSGGQLLTCVFRMAKPRDLESRGAFLIPMAGIARFEARLDPSMRLCVSARLSDPDEARSYATWRRQKGRR